MNKPKTNSMTATREKLPPRRRSHNFDIEHGGQAYHVTVGRADDGRPLEAFTHGAKAGSDMDAILDDACIVLSQLYQYGADPRDVAQRLSRSEPSVIGRVAHLVASVRPCDQCGAEDAHDVSDGSRLCLRCHTAIDHTTSTRVAEETLEWLHSLDCDLDEDCSCPVADITFEAGSVSAPDLDDLHEREYCVSIEFDETLKPIAVHGGPARGANRDGPMRGALGWGRVPPSAIALALLTHFVPIKHPLIRIALQKMAALPYDTESAHFVLEELVNRC